MINPYHYFNTFTNTKGDKLPGYIVRVLEQGTTTIADIYSDQNDTPISTVSAIDNAAVVDDDGNFSFFVEAGTYDLQFSTPSDTPVKVISYVPLQRGEQGPVGVTGPADNTYSDLASFKASDPARLTATLSGVSGVSDGKFFWETANAPYTADDANIIASDNVDVSVGAWVRQKAEGLLAADNNTVQDNLDHGGRVTPSGTGAQQQTTVSVLDKYILLTTFGAVGNDATTDTDAWQKAVTYAASSGKRLVIPPASSPYLINATATATLSTGHLEIEWQGGASLKLADGTIVNTDASYGNFTPMLRVEGGASVKLIRPRIDGNAAGQTYPATQGTFGRGSSPRRHNGCIEIIQDAGGNAPDVQIIDPDIRNAYINGVVTIFCGAVKITGGYSSENAINGFAASACASVSFTRMTAYRDGVQAGYPTSIYDGDRAQIQIREWPVNLTTATEGLTVPTLTESGITGYVYLDDCETEQCAVVGQFVRGFDRCVIGSVTNRNIGYTRLLGQSYDPTGLWVENGRSIHIDKIVLVADNVRNGTDMLPTGANIKGFYGRSDDSASPYGKRMGAYPAQINQVVAYCGQDWTSGGDYTNYANKKNNINKGFVCTQGCRVRFAYVEGWATSAFETINDTNFENLRLHDVYVDHLIAVNGIGQQALSFREYGSPTGDVERVGWGKVEVYDMRPTTTAGTDDSWAILFSTAWGPTASSAGVRLVNCHFGKVKIDGSNAAGGAVLDSAIRLHCSNASDIVIEGGEVYNVSNLIRSDGFNKLTVKDFVADTISRLLYADLTSTTTMVGNSGTLVISGNICTNVSTAPYTVNTGSSSNILNEFIDGGNKWSGTGSTVSSSTKFVLGTSPVNYNRPNSVDKMSTKFDWRRTTTGAPSFNANYLGEIAYDSAGPTYYMAINKGSGASDWKTI